MAHVRTTWKTVDTHNHSTWKWEEEGGQQSRAEEEGERNVWFGLCLLYVHILKAWSQEPSEVGPLRKLFDQKGSDLISRLILA